MNRREFSLLVAALASSRVLAAPQGKMFTIGVMVPGRREDFEHQAVFEAGLRKGGFGVGTNLKVEWRFDDRHYDRMSVLAAELVAKKVDLIVAAGTPAALAARKASTTVPIVGANITNPTELGLGASIAKPGGNVTGVINFPVNPKKIEILKAISPQTRRIAWCFNPDNPANVPTTTTTSTYRQKYSAELIMVPIRGPSDLRLLAEARQKGADALLLIHDNMINTMAKEFAEFALSQRIPSVASSGRFVEHGGLASYVHDLDAVWRKVAEYVVRVLEGVKAADLPFQQPTNFILALNRKTAKAIGATIPQELLLRADHVVD